MTFALLILFALAQPDADECRDRRPGLSKCVQYSPKTMDKGVTVEWNCKAVCYSPQKKGEPGYDGGTDANILNASGKTQDACHEELKRQCKP